MSDLSANPPDRVSPCTCNYRAQCRRARSQLDYYNNKNTKELPNDAPNFNCKACSDHTSTSPLTIQLCLPSLSPSYFDFPSQKFAFSFGSLAVPDSFLFKFHFRNIRSLPVLQNSPVINPTHKWQVGQRETDNAKQAGSDLPSLYVLRHSLVPNDY